MPLVIAGHLKDAETGVVCHVLRRMLQEKLTVEIGVLGDIGVQEVTWKSFIKQAQYLLIVLTKGCLEDLDFANAITMAQTKKRLELIPVNADKSFVYPDPTFWQNLEAGRVLNMQSAQLRGWNINQIANAYKKLFAILAKVFSPHAGWKIQLQEVDLMMRCFRNLQRTKSFEVDDPQVELQRAKASEELQLEPVKHQEEPAGQKALEHQQQEQELTGQEQAEVPAERALTAVPTAWVNI
eukprot:gnl/MRDRNA2_/MRDRNA2_60198_c0_seq1.p1 gnl/MRDRNA2_/MRDRNA2_60198_c0~~gnl/MRDRNA2_/MRDRNA2_60198_c0_seq1.p1  ORF type:complete len:259 (+),score=57.59 gnl/MRDRNA2_/MRDRNA2_60198_c0_seq1:61-777(+)